MVPGFRDLDDDGGLFPPSRVDMRHLVRLRDEAHYTAGSGARQAGERAGLTGELYELRPDVHLRRYVQTRARRRSTRRESVTPGTGMDCHRCLRSGPLLAWCRRSDLHRRPADDEPRNTANQSASGLVKPGRLRTGRVRTPALRSPYVARTAAHGRGSLTRGTEDGQRPMTARGDGRRVDGAEAAEMSVGCIVEQTPGQPVAADDWCSGKWTPVTTCCRPSGRPRVSKRPATQ